MALWLDVGHPCAAWHRCVCMCKSSNSMADCGSLHIMCPGLLLCCAQVIALDRSHVKARGIRRLAEELGITCVKVGSR